MKKGVLEKIIEIAEARGWSVDNGADYLEFSWYTPAGQDFSFEVSKKGFWSDLLNYYEDFDPSREAMMWVDDEGHGRNGAPYLLKDVIADMEAIEQKIEEFKVDLLLDNTIIF